MLFSKIILKLKWLIILAIGIFLFLLINDIPKISPVEKFVVHHKYNLVLWELNNFPQKWFFKIKQFFSLDTTPMDTQIYVLCDYFQNESDSDRQDYAEEILESVVTSALIKEGFTIWGDFVFPPVDTKLGGAPNLLVISPRDRIKRIEEVLLNPAIPLLTVEHIENTLLLDQNLSAIVIELSGIATYPSSIAKMDTLTDILDTVSHEWIHHYLFFHPLGQSIYQDSQMTTLNESIAVILGNEIGEKVWDEVNQNEKCIAIDESKDQVQNKEVMINDSFNFNMVMRETRGKVEEYLQDGEIQYAEDYMDNQRKLFVSNGYPIRKINQAYFSFYGTYANRPESISLTYKYLLEIRNRMSSSYQFLATLKNVSNYEEFLEIHRQLTNDKG